VQLKTLLLLGICFLPMGGVGVSINNALLWKPQSQHWIINP